MQKGPIPNLKDVKERTGSVGSTAKMMKMLGVSEKELDNKTKRKVFGFNENSNSLVECRRCRRRGYRLR